MAEKNKFGNSGPSNPDIKRSTFDLSFVNNLTFRPGVAVPVLVQLAEPNTSFSIDTNFAFDFQPMYYPIQNNLRMHFSVFTVPFRICWKHYKRFNDLIGSDGQINGSNNYVMPYIKRAHGSDTWNEQNSLFDYMGLPTQCFNKVVDSLTLKKKNNECFIYALRQLYSGGTPTNDIIDLYNPNSVIPVPSGFSTNHVTFGMTLNLSNVDFPDSPTIRVPFYVDETTFVLSDFLGSLSSTHATFTLHYGFSRDHGTADPWSLRGSDYSIHSEGHVTLTADVKKERVYVVNGRSVGLYYYEFSIDSSAVVAVKNAAAAHKVFVLQMDSDDGGLTSLTPLATRYFTSAEPVHMTDIHSEGKEGEIIYDSLTPLITYYGWTGEVQVSHNRALNGSSLRFCSVNGADPDYPVNAIPFRAYEFIKNFFFRNNRVDPFYKDGQPCYDEFLTNDGDGADSTTPVSLFNVPWEYDLFTTAVPQPFYGNAPLVGVTSNRNDQGELTTATFHMVDDNQVPYTFNVDTDHTGRITGISLQGENNGNAANTPAMNALNYAIQYGISIADFRNADALTRFVEKRMSAGNLHPDIVQEFYGSRPSLGEEYPRYVGGCTRRVNINKIVNTAQSEGNPLGDYAGTAVVNGSCERLKIFCAERSYIIGIMWLSVTPTYPQMCPSHFFKSSIFDYVNPLFNNISPQPIPTKWLAPLQLGDEELEDVFGYGRPYADYVSRQDEVHGDFRGNMSDFLLQRLFMDKPRLNRSFLNIRSSDISKVFSETSDNDKILGQVAFSIRAKLPLPYVSVPQII